MTAFAVVWNGDISVNTVSDTPRGAKVNGLVTLFGMRVLDVHTDEQIAAAWAELERRMPDVHVATVEISFR